MPSQSSLRCPTDPARRRPRVACPGAIAAGSAPAVTTGGVSNVTFSSAILYGYVNARGLPTNYAFQYGTTSGYGGQTPLAPAGNGTISIKLSAPVTGLLPGTTFHYRILAVNSAGTTDGKDRTFTTASVPLSVQIAGVPNPVAPAEVGALVGFQLLRPGRSVNAGGTIVRAGTASVSRFSRIVRVRHRGLYRALVRVSDGAHVSNYSQPILIR